MARWTTMILLEVISKACELLVNSHPGRLDMVLYDFCIGLAHLHCSKTVPIGRPSPGFSKLSSRSQFMHTWSKET